MESTKNNREIPKHILERWNIFDRLVYDAYHGLDRYDHPVYKDLEKGCELGCSCKRCEPPIEDMTDYGGFLTY